MVRVLLAAKCRAKHMDHTQFASMSTTQLPPPAPLECHRCCRCSHPPTQPRPLPLLPAEGGVYYSDQQFVGAGGGGDEAALPSRAQALAKFGEFIRTFQVDPKSGSFPYA